MHAMRTAVTAQAGAGGRWVRMVVDGRVRTMVVGHALAEQAHGASIVTL
jgi:hypothetical protein